MKLYAIVVISNSNGEVKYFIDFHMYNTKKDIYGQSFPKWYANYSANLEISYCYYDYNEAYKDIPMLQTIEKDQIQIIEIDSKDLSKPTRFTGQL
jgi:hypothetical protein